MSRPLEMTVDTATRGPRWAALIVAHGSPSAPEAPEAAMTALGQAVGAVLGPDWAVRGTTLAAPGALAAAVRALPERPLIYPHFMADGWFTATEVPRRVAEAGAHVPHFLPAFGLDPNLAALCLDRLREAAAERAAAPGKLTLILAAHGSPRSPRPGQAARALRGRIAAAGLFREVRLGFVDEAPALAQIARDAGPGLCLPLFAGRAYHVEVDLPQALARARFDGPLLAPIGADPAVPAMIAASLAGAAMRRNPAEPSLISAPRAMQISRPGTSGILQP